MNKAIVISKHPIPSRPQVALVVQTVIGYSVCVIPADFHVVAGQELIADEVRRGVWRLSAHGDVFPSAINGTMSMEEARVCVSHILSL